MYFRSTHSQPILVNIKTIALFSRLYYSVGRSNFALFALFCLERHSLALGHKKRWLNHFLLSKVVEGRLYLVRERRGTIILVLLMVDILNLVLSESCFLSTNEVLRYFYHVIERLKWRNIGVVWPRTRNLS